MYLQISIVHIFKKNPRILSLKDKMKTKEENLYG